MLFRDPRLVAVLGAVTLCAAPKLAPAQPRESASAEPAPPPHVHVVLVGRAQDGPALSGRLCTLFDPRTDCDIDTAVRLDSSAVLEPDAYQTVYVWITLASHARARVYVSTRTGEAPRYLFRDVALESGLDEIGEEMLAQIAHSSALALWARDQETSARELARELERETESPVRALPPNHPATRAPRKAAPPSISRQAEPNRPVRTAPARLRLDLGAQYSAHSSGGEGLHHEPGAFLSVLCQEQFRLSLAGAYLVPSSFEVGPARVTLQGASAEVRVGHLVGPAQGVRLRLDAGAGALWVRWRASAEAPARAAPGQQRQRGYAVGAVAVEVPARPLRLGARLELRVPFKEATYDIAADGQKVQDTSTWLSPGLGLEVGAPLERRP